MRASASQLHYGHQGSAMVRGLSFTPADAVGLPSLSLYLGGRPVVLQGDEALPTSKQVHVGLVLDPASGNAGLYVDGMQVAAAAMSGSLSDLRDVDNWLGRSHVVSDPGLSGSLSELRIYGRALTQQELVTSRDAGPDPHFLD